MKLTLILITLLLGQSAFAETPREKRIREEMLTRVDLLKSKVVDTRKHLDKEDVVKACAGIKEIFEIYPEHVDDIGIHMDLLKGKVSRMKDKAIAELIFIHQQVNLCNRGTDSEYVDPRPLNNHLRNLVRSLNDQRKIIKKEDTDFENEFYYEYEF